MNPTLAGWIRGTHTREPAYTGGRPGCQTGSIFALAPSSQIPKREATAASNLDTLLDRGIDRVVHAVEFSKTAAPLREGTPSERYALEPKGLPRTGPTSIALSAGRDQPRAAVRHRAPRGYRHLTRPEYFRRSGRRAQETICTVTARRRGRSSKSIRTICCQVPIPSEPSTSGSVTDGPITAARRWACAFESWLSRLCS